jgi:hypothetical protein
MLFLFSFMDNFSTGVYGDFVGNLKVAQRAISQSILLAIW